MALLKRIKQDMTFNQDAFAHMEHFLQSPIFFSFDLTNATDRFPALLQKAVMEHMLGKERGMA